MKIIRVVVALIVVAVILVGLPLAAWWVGNRRFWGRLRPSPTPVLQDDLRSRLGLTAPELTQARQAAHSGRTLTEPRMRAATVEVARDSLARTGRQWRLGIAGGVCTAVGIAIGLAAGGWGDNPALYSSLAVLATLNLVAQVAVPTFVRRRLRRAIELNREPVAEDQP